MLWKKCSKTGLPSLRDREEELDGRPLFCSPGKAPGSWSVISMPGRRRKRWKRSGKNGGEAISCVGDMTAREFPETLVKAAVDQWGALHILVNNAGFTWDSLVNKMSDEQWDKIIDLHLKAPFRMMRAAAPYFVDAAKKEMEERGKAVTRKIINISSVAGVSGNVGQANYSSAKSGVVGLTKTMCKEWARYNVQSNCVAFGFIDTRLTQDKEKGIAVEMHGKKIAVGVPEKVRQGFIQLIPAGRPGTPEEAANAIFFFASPLSDYVSGQLLVVGGGFSM